MGCFCAVPEEFYCEVLLLDESKLTLTTQQQGIKVRADGGSPPANTSACPGAGLRAPRCGCLAASASPPPFGSRGGSGDRKKKGFRDPAGGENKKTTS